MERPGAFVISLDFELMWGMLDTPIAKTYSHTNVANVATVVGRLLELFQQYGIHATFATVGFIYYSSKSELLAQIPNETPTYTDDKLSPYGNHLDAIGENDTNLYFYPELIEKIRVANGQEIGTHTYCHYYCYADGQTRNQFEADIESAIKTASAHGDKIRSIVFPRNQVSPGYLKVCNDKGIKIYRGNTPKLYNEELTGLMRKVQSIVRLIDHYIPLYTKNTIDFSDIKESSGMYNVRASRFLRPYNKILSIFDFLRIRRMKNEMTKAAKEGRIYHLWWHPHNMGNNLEKNFRILEKLLRHYAALRVAYGMDSLNMSEVADQF